MISPRAFALALLALPGLAGCGNYLRTETTPPGPVMCATDQELFHGACVDPALRYEPAERVDHDNVAAFGDPLVQLKLPDPPKSGIAKPFCVLARDRQQVRLGGHRREGRHAARRQSDTPCEAHAALAPGAVLVAVETAELPRFLPTGFGEGLEDRLRDAMAAAGWNRHDDRQADLEAAGFTVERRVFAGAVDPVPPATAAYAQAWLGRVRHGLGDALTAVDRDLLDELLGDGPEGLRRRADLTVRGARVA